jgi:hypothetical protein
MLQRVLICSKITIRNSRLSRLGIATGAKNHRLVRLSHKNRLNYTGIRSTSRSSPGRNVTDVTCWPSDTTPPAFGYAGGEEVWSRGG